MTKRFENKRAIVTGAAHGIGRATALRLALEGASVLAADSDQAAAEETAELLSQSGGKSDAFVLDVSDRQQVNAMVDHAVSSWGGVDVLVSNAGIMDREPFLEMTDELWDRVISVNLKGVFLCGQAVARQMVDQGNAPLAHVPSAVRYPAPVSTIAHRCNALQMPMRLPR